MNGLEIEKTLTDVFAASRKYSRNAKFLGVFAKDRLPVTIPRDCPCLLVANTDDHSKPGQHWVAMYIQSNNAYAEYFDSFGEPPLPVFASYLLRHAKRIKCNRKQIQSIASMYCGQYVVLYCAFRAIGYKVHKFASMFTKDFGFNDMFAHHLACKMLAR